MSNCALCELEGTCECEGHNIRAAKSRPDQVIVGLIIFTILLVVLAIDDLLQEIHKVFKARR
jgi:hypothetical protein